MVYRPVYVSLLARVALPLASGVCFCVAACSESGSQVAPGGLADASTGGLAGSGPSGAGGAPQAGASAGGAAGSGSGGVAAGSGAPGSGGEAGDHPVEWVPGLWSEYYASYHDLALERLEPSLDLDFGDTGPSAEVGSDHFSARFSGAIAPVTSGSYLLAVESDDGVRVWLDGALVIDDWHPHFSTRSEATVQLQAGARHVLEVEHFEVDLEASIRLLWVPPGGTEEVIGEPYLLTSQQASERGAPKPPFQNPVMDFDCPDPGVMSLEEQGAPRYYAVCTGGTFKIRSSRDLVFWEDTGASILPDGKPSWAANGGRNWAPELHRVGDKVVAYFTSVDADDKLCVGAAAADSATGPYTVSAAPLVQDAKGVIDATFFQEDDGSAFLIYKIDGNAAGQPTPMYARELSADGLSFAQGSSAVQVLVNDSSTWEGGVVEGPWVVKRSGYYYLFYSGNVYDERYRTGVARSTSLLGPYEKHGDPLLVNNEQWVGPGHGSVVAVGGSDFFVYHAWHNNGTGGRVAASGRAVLLDAISYAGGWPAIGAGSPTSTLQAWPE